MEFESIQPLQRIKTSNSEMYRKMRILLRARFKKQYKYSLTLDFILEYFKAHPQEFDRMLEIAFPDEQERTKVKELLK